MYKVTFLGYLVELLDAIRKSKGVHDLRVVIEPQRIQSKLVIRYCEEHSIPYFLEKSIRTTGRFNELFPEDLDLMIVGAFGQVLDKKILERPRFGTVNFHPSLLPNYRGGSPIEEQILAGECVSGYTLSWMTEEVDSGTVISQEGFPIGDSHYYEDIRDESVAWAAHCLGALLAKPVNTWPSKEVGYLGKLYRPREAHEGALNWADNARSISAKVRAFGWRGWAVAWRDDGVKITIVRVAHYCFSETPTPGVVALDGKRLIVGAGDGWLELLEYECSTEFKSGDVLLSWEDGGLNSVQ